VSLSLHGSFRLFGLSRHTQNPLQNSAIAAPDRLDVTQEAA
jgi:hypothetical protein